MVVRISRSASVYDKFRYCALGNNPQLHHPYKVDPKRVVWHEPINTLFRRRDRIVKLLRHTRERNGRARKIVLEVMISWYYDPDGVQPADSPTEDEMHWVSQVVLRELGLHEHLGATFRHGDAANDHLHTIVSTIHPHTFKVWRPDFNVWRRAWNTKRRLEREFGWKEVGPFKFDDLFNSEDIPRSSPHRKPDMMEKRGKRPSIKTEASSLLWTPLRLAWSWEWLLEKIDERRKDIRLEERHHGTGMVVIIDGREIGLGNIHPAFSLPRLEARFGETWREYQERMETRRWWNTGYDDARSARARPSRPAQSPRAHRDPSSSWRSDVENMRPEDMVQERRRRTPDAPHDRREDTPDAPHDQREDTPDAPNDQRGDTPDAPNDQREGKPRTTAPQNEMTRGGATNKNTCAEGHGNPTAASGEPANGNFEQDRRPARPTDAPGTQSSAAASPHGAERNTPSVEQFIDRYFRFDKERSCYTVRFAQLVESDSDSEHSGPPQRPMAERPSDAAVNAARIYETCRLERLREDLDDRVRSMQHILQLGTASDARRALDRAGRALGEKLRDVYADPDETRNRLTAFIDQNGFPAAIETLAFEPERFGTTTSYGAPTRRLWTVRDDYERGVQTAGDALRLSDRKQVVWPLARYALTRAAWLELGARDSAHRDSPQVSTWTRRAISDLKRACDDTQSELETMPSREELREEADRIAGSTTPSDGSLLRDLHDRVDDLSRASRSAYTWRDEEERQRMAWHRLYEDPESARSAFFQYAFAGDMRGPDSRYDDAFRALKRTPEQFGAVRSNRSGIRADEREDRVGSLVKTLRRCIEQVDRTREAVAALSGAPSKQSLSRRDLILVGGVLASQAVARSLRDEHWAVSKSHVYRGHTRGISRF